jgi:hypothetical protein
MSATGLPIQHAHRLELGRELPATAVPSVPHRRSWETLPEAQIVKLAPVTFVSLVVLSPRSLVIFWFSRGGPDLFNHNGAIPGLGSQSVVVAVWTPRGITYIGG